MIKLPESRVASFLANREELWQGASETEKQIALETARREIEKENQRRKKIQELERKRDLAAFAFYKMRLGELE